MLCGIICRNIFYPFSLWSGEKYCSSFACGYCGIAGTAGSWNCKDGFKVGDLVMFENFYFVFDLFMALVTILMGLYFYK